MRPHPPLEALIPSFLAQLFAEEELLQTARNVSAELFAVLRKGDLAAIEPALPRQDELSVALRAACENRESAAIQLACALDLPTQHLTLTRLAGRLGPPHAAALLAARKRLTALAAELAEFQRRNANLIHYLRSYFRGVLAALTKTAEVPVRYGASGVRLNPFGGASLRG